MLILYYVMELVTRANFLKLIFSIYNTQVEMRIILFLFYLPMKYWIWRVATFLYDTFWIISTSIPIFPSINWLYKLNQIPIKSRKSVLILCLVICNTKKSTWNKEIRYFIPWYQNTTQYYIHNALYLNALYLHIHIIEQVIYRNNFPRLSIYNWKKYETNRKNCRKLFLMFKKNRLKLWMKGSIFFSRFMIRKSLI